MTDDEATTLVARIKGTWRGGPDVNAWRAVLVDLDVGTAGTALARLARLRDDAPTVRQYLDQYRALDTPANDRVEACDRCDGTGFVEAPPIYAVVNGQAHAYTTVTRCTCPPNLGSSRDVL